MQNDYILAESTSWAELGQCVEELAEDGEITGRDRSELLCDIQKNCMRVLAENLSDVHIVHLGEAVVLVPEVQLTIQWMTGECGTGLWYSYPGSVMCGTEHDVRTHLKNAESTALQAL